MSKIPEDVLFRASLEAGLIPCKGCWEGTAEQVRDAAKKLGLTVEEYSEALGANRKALIRELTQHWSELVKKVHYAFAYGLECNDMTHGEVEDEIAFALDRFALMCGLPKHDWDTEYEKQYGETQED